MKSIEEQLPASMFLRIHKSYILPKEHITAIRKNTVFINSNQFPVVENYKEAITNMVDS